MRSYENLITEDLIEIYNEIMTTEYIKKRQRYLTKLGSNISFLSNLGIGGRRNVFFENTKIG